MTRTNFAAFAAGFLAGGIVLGGVVAHARITSVNLSIAGVPPNSEGSLLCVTAGNAVRPIVGTQRLITVQAPGGGTSTGTSLRCPG